MANEKFEYPDYTEDELRQAYEEFKRNSPFDPTRLFVAMLEAERGLGMALDALDEYGDDDTLDRLESIPSMYDEIQNVLGIPEHGDEIDGQKFSREYYAFQLHALSMDLSDLEFSVSDDDDEDEIMQELKDAILDDTIDPEAVELTIGEMLLNLKNGIVITEDLVEELIGSELDYLDEMVDYDDEDEEENEDEGLFDDDEDDDR